MIVLARNLERCWVPHHSGMTVHTFHGDSHDLNGWSPGLEVSLSGCEIDTANIFIIWVNRKPYPFQKTMQTQYGRTCPRLTKKKGALDNQFFSPIGF